MYRHAAMAMALFLSAAAPTSAQKAPAPPSATQSPALAQLVAEARAARVKGDIPNWLAIGSQALALAPDHPDLLISISRANAAAGNKQKALALLEDAVRRGAGLDPVRFVEFKSLGVDDQFLAAAEAARANLKPTGTPAIFVRNAGEPSEGIAYDPASKRFFAAPGDGRIVTIETSGKVEPFVVGGGLRQILGIKVDSSRNLLWLVSGRYPEGQNDPPDAGTAEVRAYDIGTRKLVRKLEMNELPTQHGLNDLALASDGTVFVTDTVGGAVYRAGPRAMQLEILLRDPKMTFPNGIALSRDERLLYVAHVEGISAIDPRTGTRSLLSIPANSSVNSIDGLLFGDGQLFGVQNSPYLNRLVGMQLSRDGRAIEKVWAVSAHNPGDRNKTTAAHADGAIYITGGAPAPDVYGGGEEAAKPEFMIWRIALQ